MITRPREENFFQEWRGRRGEKMMPDQQTFDAPSGEVKDMRFFIRRATPSEESRDDEGETADDSLEDAARSEQEYVRERLRSELKREPTEEEMSEWLREHTEGY